MKIDNLIQATVLLALILLVTAGCSRDTGTLQPAPPITDPVVFDDDFGSKVDFQAFMGSYLYALTIDAQEKHDGVASLKVTVPPPGAYAGGAFTTGALRDLSGYNALTFWAKASEPATLNVTGLGNDNTGNSKYTAQWNNVPLTAEWTYYVIPIPLPEKLTSEGGLFFFAEDAEDDNGCTIWFDQVIFKSDTTISNPRPVMESRTMSTFVGATVNATGTQTIFDVDGTDELIVHMPGYLTFASSNDTVAAIVNGAIKTIGGGTATITAMLGEAAVIGELTLNVFASPAVPAPTPTPPAADVISLFSNAYSNITIDKWLADWSSLATVTDFRVSGDDIKTYTTSSYLGYAGIEFTTSLVNAADMTHFHFDLWMPTQQGVTFMFFRVKLVDFGADGAYQGTDPGDEDTERELTFSTTTNPAIVPGSWVSFDIPLANFMGTPGLASRAHLAQLVVSGGGMKSGGQWTGMIAFVDNIYFHK
jgi:hypothetical protein